MAAKMTGEMEKSGSRIKEVEHDVVRKPITLFGNML